MIKRLPFVPVIVGPTASGKTDLAYGLARELDATVISADSRQMYKELDIGTAKPTSEQLSKVAHLFIDHVEPDVTYSAGDFGREARKTITNLLDQESNVIVAGGSGMYIKALLDGILELDFKDDSIRRALRKRFDENGLEALYEELKKADPRLAARISSNDKQRILRGLEVYEVSGKPLSEWHEQETEKAPFNFRLYGLNWPREVLYDRINKRVEQMLENSLVEEVRTLRERDLQKTNALNAVGYKEVVSYLEGDHDYDTMREHIKRNTRRFAKRQLTWFNADKRIHWFHCEKFKSLTHLKNEVLDNIIS